MANSTETTQDGASWDRRIMNAKIKPVTKAEVRTYLRQLAEHRSKESPCKFVPLAMAAMPSALTFKFGPG
jgi:hypothetical protein